jgi:hypothetical protein
LQAYYSGHIFIISIIILIVSIKKMPISVLENRMPEPSAHLFPGFGFLHRPDPGAESRRYVGRRQTVHLFTDHEDSSDSVCHCVPPVNDYAERPANFPGPREAAGNLIITGMANPIHAFFRVFPLRPAAIPVCAGVLSEFHSLRKTESPFWD